MNKKWIGIWAVMALAVLSWAGPGEDPEDTEDKKVDEHVISWGERVVEPPRQATTATKLDVPLKHTPASVSVVTGNLIHRQDGKVLGDALRNISGVNVETGSGVYDFFLIRGFDSLSNGLVLTDGTLEPEVTFYNLYNIDRVEVLKGPGAFLYGGNPLSGTVNLMRKQPLFDDFADLTMSYGSFESFNGSLDYGVSSQEENLAFRVNGMWRESDGFRDDKDNQTAAINPSLTFRSGSSRRYLRSADQPDSVGMGIPAQ